MQGDQVILGGMDQKGGDTDGTHLVPIGVVLPVLRRDLKGQSEVAEQAKGVAEAALHDEPPERIVGLKGHLNGRGTPKGTPHDEDGIGIAPFLHDLSEPLEDGVGIVQDMAYGRLTRAQSIAAIVGHKEVDPQSGIERGDKIVVPRGLAITVEVQDGGNPFGGRIESTDNGDPLPHLHWIKGDVILWRMISPGIEDELGDLRPVEGGSIPVILSRAHRFSLPVPGGWPA